MIMQFSPSNNGKAIQTLSNFNGFLALFAFAPFWISNNRQVETVQGAPPGGFNLEARDGIYIIPPATGMIVTIEWHGDLFILNGTGANDQLNNVVVVLPQVLC